MKRVFSLLLAAVLCGACSREEAVAPASNPAPVPPEVAAQNRAQLTQTLSTMTPEQRTTYLQAHPEAIQALKP